MTATRRDPDRLFTLLPALYRIVDSERGGQLQALLALITEQADAVHGDIEQLWDDFFIETCRRWVVPYIGELVGNIALHDLDLSIASATAESLFTDLAGPDLRPPGAIRTRADVAKTIYYRRRKGTPSMLEELARDVTGWDARVVEFFTLLGWNQHLEHLRPEAHGCPDLRAVDVGDRVGGPWDTTTHTVDVRRINAWDGWYNIPNIGFFLWRLRAFPLTRVTPRPIGGTAWRLTFSPLGHDVALYSSGGHQPGESQRATELTVEAPIRAAAFFADLGAVAPPPPTTAYYGPATEASLVVFSNGTPVPAGEVACTNLADWGTFARPPGITIRLDVTRGRMVIPSGRGPNEVITVSFFYGFSAQMGGGEYDRSKWLVPPSPPVKVTGGGNTLQAALAIPRPASARTVIEIGDSATYDLTTSITLAANERLTIQGAARARPHVRLANGAVSVLSTGAGASLTLGGLLVEGGVLVDGDLDRLRLLHTTLVPGRSVLQEAAGKPTGPSLVVAPGAPGALVNKGLKVEIAFSLVGALRIPSHVTGLWLLDSIVDGILADGAQPVAAVSDAAGSGGPPAHIERSTLFGTSRFDQLTMASESIFTGQVNVNQRQAGCVRFSFVPRGSVTPQQYRCQPALEIGLAIDRRRTEATKQGVTLPAGFEATVAAEVARWLVAAFESRRYGDAAFAQLRRTCPQEVRTGAEDGSEMGAFCVLKQPQRTANLRLRLDEYLPIGLEAGIVYVT